MANALTEVVTRIVDILEPLSPEDRRRAIAASLTLVGDGPVVPASANLVDQPEAGEAPAGLNPRALAWMKQNYISVEELEQTFHVAEGAVEVIASEIPGKNAKEKTYAAYVLTGVGQLLATGNPVFEDKAARALCRTLGCLNEANHAAYLADKGNEFTGSKATGWTLTAPGLKRGAAIIKELGKKE